MSPNPLVGCVLLRDGGVVGEGWHAEYGGVHAERMALEQAGERARGCTAIVTLEPCAHQGKQPPCVDALIAAGVRRVVVALPDPNPEAKGGVAKLRAAGIEVEVGVMDGEARRLNAPFLHRYTSSRRPWVALKLATSREGWIAPADRTRTQLSGAAAQEWVHHLRAGFDAIAVGGRTAKLDDPSLTVRGNVTPRVPPLRVLFAGVETLPPTLKLLSDGGSEVVVVRGGVDRSVLEGLRRERNITALLVEGGGALATSLVKQDLVDRYYWIETPVALGGSGIPAFAGAEEGRGAPPGSWVETERKSLGPDILHVMERA